MIPERVPTYAELLARRDAPAGSSWGVFGAEDELGMLNFLTPERAAAAARAVVTGRSFNLDYPLNTFVPAMTTHRAATVHHMLANNPNHRDDWLDSFYLQSTSQVDGLRHIRSPRHGFYNGIDDSKVSLNWPDQPELGIQLLAERAIVARGVLLDAKAYFEHLGTPLRMDRPHHITTIELDAIAEFCAVEVRPGDIVLLHLGWAEWWIATRPTREQRLGTPGLEQSREMLAWIWDHQIAMFAADNGGLEGGPKLPGTDLWEPDEPDPERGTSQNGSLHRQLIPLLGMNMGELWKLHELAAACGEDGVYEFMLTCSPLNLVGGVGSPPNAIAIK